MSLMSVKDRRRAGANKTTNLGDIETFARVVAASSMTAAASELGVAVGVVSKRIQRLEAKLGARLIERTTRRLLLTEAGEGFYQRVNRILEAFEEAIEFTSEISTSLRGVLRVTAPTSFGRMHVAPYLPRFLESHPSLEIDLDLSDDYVDIVGRGFHVAIRIGELADSSLISRKLAPIHRVLCAAPSYIARFGEPETIADLSAHNLLAPDNQDCWSLEGPEGGVMLPVRGRLRTNSSEVVREAVVAGFGVALRSTWDVGAELASGELRAVLPAYRSPGRIGLFALYPSRDLMPVKVRTFVDFVAGLYGLRPYWDRGLRSDEAGRASEAISPANAVL
ncbi:LysR family transcriptional regulator [Bradyrhizobium sp. AZCC 1693]|uniref:LysR family transcriptional regulator n=1 Tax=Bradyrhizobium sp. AZCC 1693 TaxID=3117029 RepID=UPI002FEFB911